MDLRDQQGTRFDQRFILQTRLGDGMSSAVYVVKERATGREFACKLAHRGSRKVSWGHLQRTFKREAMFLEQLAEAQGGPHKNIVCCRGMFNGYNEIALVLDLVRGGDLQQLLQRHGCLSERAARSIAQQVAEALTHVHSLGIVHRDVKLENILVTSADSPCIKLCDFGHSALLADVVRKDGRSDRFLGTPGYVAPEVLQNPTQPMWSPAADVWGIGAVLYALLSNMSLRWAEGGRLDFSSRALMRVSTAIKLLIQAIIVVNVQQRARLDQVLEMLQQLGSEPNPSEGLRREGRLGRHSFSLLNMSSIVTDDDLSNAIQRQAAVNRDATNGSSADSIASTILDEADAETPRALETVGSARAEDDSCFAVTKHSWRGAYARLLHIGEDRVSTLEPHTGRVTNEWTSDQLLQV